MKTISFQLNRIIFNFVAPSDAICIAKIVYEAFKSKRFSLNIEDVLIAPILQVQKLGP